MSHITYEKFLNICAEYSRHGCFSEANKRFGQRVLERMFYRGKHGSLLSICMCAYKGCITVPEDVEHIEKIKVNGITQSLFSHWWEYSTATEQDFSTNYCGVAHLPDKFYTQYDSPYTSFFPVIRARASNEDPSSFIKIHGRDINGEKVFLRHNSETVAGEWLPIISGSRVEGTIPFVTISGIEKSETKGYIDLYAKDPATGEMSYLSGYSPRETKPFYTRIKVSGCPDGQKVKLDILAKLKILNTYADNELLPIIGVDIVEQIAQEIRLGKDNDFQNSIAAGAVAKELIRDENNYKYSAGQDVMDFVDMGDDSGEVW